VLLGYSKTKASHQNTPNKSYKTSNNEIPMEVVGEDGRYSLEWEEANAQRKESARPKPERH
jgi:hypothetical protein